MELKSKAEVKTVFENYPPFVQDKMYFLRNLVIETAEETEGITTLEECLKWGEPSYLCKYGSTIRMDWKSKSPKQYALYFKCTSRLVETFRLVFGNTFQYEGNRAIIFELDQKLPISEVKACIKAALRYHKVKNLISLGI